MFITCPLITTTLMVTCLKRMALYTTMGMGTISITAPTAITSTLCIQMKNRVHSGAGTALLQFACSAIVLKKMKKQSKSQSMLQLTMSTLLLSLVTRKMKKKKSFFLERWKMQNVLTFQPQEWVCPKYRLKFLLNH